MYQPTRWSASFRWALLSYACRLFTKVWICYRNWDKEVGLKLRPAYFGLNQSRKNYQQPANSEAKPLNLPEELWISSGPAVDCVLALAGVRHLIMFYHDSDTITSNVTITRVPSNPAPVQNRGKAREGGIARNSSDRVGYMLATSQQADSLERDRLEGIIDLQ